MLLQLLAAYGYYGNGPRRNMHKLHQHDAYIIKITNRELHFPFYFEISQASVPLCTSITMAITKQRDYAAMLQQQCDQMNQYVILCQ